MKLFLFNILLAVVWAAVNASFSAVSLAVGFVLGYLVILLMRPALGSSAYYTGVWRTLGFALFYVRELVVSSVRVAVDVLTPSLDAKPGIIAYPLEAETDAEITVFANLVSLTPGTLSLDVSDDRKTLYIHAMYLDDGTGEEEIANLKNRLERRVLRLFRLAESPN
jgi:multicomponent Na+:H+ antiporter subunit E